LLDQHVDPIAGEDIQLTIDLDYQQYAEQALETKLKQRRDLPTDLTLQDVAAHNPIDPKDPGGTTRVYASSKEFGQQEWIQYKAPAGAVVMEDNSNGQIIAMASYPRFDNRWMGAIDGNKFDQLFGDKIDPITGKPDPDKSVLIAYGAFGSKQMYGREVQGVIRSTFVIAPDGRIEAAFYNVKATIPF